MTDRRTVDRRTHDKRRAPELGSLPAEREVLGALMVEPEAWDRIDPQLQEHDFTDSTHRAIYSAIKQLIAEGEEVNGVTVSARLDQLKQLGQGRGKYIAELCHDTWTTGAVSAHADLIRDYSLRRSILAALRDAQSIAREPGNGEVLLDRIQGLLGALAFDSEAGLKPVSSLLPDVASQIDAAATLKTDVTGLDTPWRALDKLTAGFQPGDLIILAARPSMGKTSMALNLAEHTAHVNGLPVAFFSAEMSADQLVKRSIASLGRIPHDAVRSGKMRDEDWARLNEVMGDINRAPLWIDDTSAIKPSQIASRARKLKRQHPDLALIVVDYIQLMGSDIRAESKNLEVAEQSRALKGLAKELHVPIVALSQLSRGLEQRADKRPMPSDLRDSGSIEQDADVILFIYRDEVYNALSPDKGLAEVIISKHRNGPTGMVPLRFFGHFCRFDPFVGQLPSRQQADIDGPLQNGPGHSRAINSAGGRGFRW